MPSESWICKKFSRFDTLDKQQWKKYSWSCTLRLCSLHWKVSSNLFLIYSNFWCLIEKICQKKYSIYFLKNVFLCMPKIFFNFFFIHLDAQPWTIISSSEGPAKNFRMKEMKKIFHLFPPHFLLFAMCPNLKSKVGMRANERNFLREKKNLVDK